MRKDTKRCSLCGRRKPIEMFISSDSVARSTTCRDCRRGQYNPDGAPIEMTADEVARNVREAVATGRIHESFYNGRYTGSFRCPVCGMTTKTAKAAFDCCVPGVIRNQVLRYAGYTDNDAVGFVLRAWAKMLEGRERDEWILNERVAAAVRVPAKMLNEITHEVIANCYPGTRRLLA